MLTFDSEDAARNSDSQLAPRIPEGANRRAGPGGGSSAMGPVGLVASEPAVRLREDKVLEYPVPLEVDVSVKSSVL